MSAPLCAGGQQVFFIDNLEDSSPSGASERVATESARMGAGWQCAGDSLCDGHRRQRENQILRLLGEGPRSAAEFVPAMYKGLDEKLHKAAEMSVTAHLIDLERRGLVARSGEQWRTI